MGELTQSSPHGLADVVGQDVRRRLCADLRMDGLPTSRVQLIDLCLHAFGDELFVHTCYRL